MAPPGGVLHATNIGTHNASLLGIFSAAQHNGDRAEVHRVVGALRDAHDLVIAPI